MHKLVNHCKPVNVAQSVHIQNAIDNYMDYFRQEFTPEYTVIVKQHLLEDHCVDDIQRFGLGLGILGEQGFESVHRKFKEILKRHSTLAPSKRLLKALQEHESLPVPIFSHSSQLKRLKDNHSDLCNT